MTFINETKSNWAFLLQEKRANLLFKDMRMLRVLLVVLSLAWPRGVVSETRLWKGIQRPTDLDSSTGTQETLTLSSLIQCAMKASMSPWCYMYKYEAGECVLYDRKEGSEGPLKLLDNTNTPTVFTRLINGQCLSISREVFLLSISNLVFFSKIFRLNIFIMTKVCYGLFNSFPNFYVF